MTESDDQGSRTTPTTKATGKRTAGTRAASKKTAAAPASAPRRQARPKLAAPQVASRAAHQLLELTGRQAEGVTGLSRTDDGGWTVLVEVVEARRIPDTTDVLALYEVQVDNDADLLGYHRVRRYVRGKPGEE